MVTASTIYAFEAWLKGHEECSRVVHHRTLGKAKYQRKATACDVSGLRLVAGGEG